MRCTIVPPHVLERVLEHTDDSDLRARARRSLVIDAGNRVGRRLTLLTAPGEATAAVAPNRTIKDAKHREELPGDTVRTEGASATGDTTCDVAYDWLGVTFEF